MKTPEEIIENTLLLKTHLEYLGVYDNVIQCMEEYASQSKPESVANLANICDNETTIKSVTNCPTCGSECEVGSGDSGSHYYIPKSKPQEIEWISSEIKPESDKPVLAIIESGKYPVRVMWVKEYSISAEDWEYNGDEDYNEEDDKFYWPEGWYEWNEMEEVRWMCKKVSYWKELPNLPFLTNKTE